MLVIERREGDGCMLLRMGSLFGMVAVKEEHVAMAFVEGVGAALDQLETIAKALVHP
jgi:hypothetical protein